MATISISNEKIMRQKGVVVLPIREYQKLCEMAVPTFYLKGKEAIKLDKLVKDGLKEYQKGKSKTIKSLADLG